LISAACGGNQKIRLFRNKKKKIKKKMMFRLKIGSGEKRQWQRAGSKQENKWNIHFSFLLLFFLFENLIFSISSATLTLRY
jgi:hypothetical protein